jgi:methylisocitrate lyase
MVEKIRAARGSTHNDLLIIARTDACSVEGFDAAVARAKLYLEAGAEMIFPEALESEAEFARFAEEVDAPLIANMTEFGKSPLLSYDVFVRMGYAAVLYPMTAFRAAMHAAESALAAILEQGDQRTILDRLMTRAELYEHIDYREGEEADRRYFGDSTHPR